MPEKKTGSRGGRGMEGEEGENARYVSSGFNKYFPPEEKIVALTPGNVGLKMTFRRQNSEIINLSALHRSAPTKQFCILLNH